MSSKTRVVDGGGSEGSVPKPSGAKKPASGSGFFLKLLSGSAQGDLFPIDSPEISIGRGPQNNILLNDLEVSRNHAMIVSEKEGFFIHDLGSSNGTFVSGKKVKTALLSPGDEIRMGGVILRFVDDPDRDYSNINRRPAPAPGRVSTAPERVTFDSYEIIEEIGVGGYSTVYRAKLVPGGGFAAVKIPHRDIIAEPENLERIKREGELGIKLNHKNIMRIYGMVMDGKVPHLVMELLEGSSLNELIYKKRGPLDLKFTLDVASQTLSALDYAHGLNIVHRDLKPANLMLMRNGIVKVMDFGIARITTKRTITSLGTIIGTPYYMSPQQARGDRVDHRSDLYSMGVILFEMATGRPPFEGDHLAVLNKHIQENPPAPSSINRNIPEYLEAVILKAMRKNPGDRFSSASEMARELMLATIRREAPPPRKQPAGGGAKDISGGGYLTVISVEAKGVVIRLGVDPVRIGRSPENDIALNYDAKASRRHAMIKVDNGRYVIEDLGSKNGTTVNGKPVTRIPLSQGDKIQIGRTTFVFGQ
ncbi:MAG: FHA domain-containing protein [Deltaproteobacteria bacterium]|uniref:non-specific serine/threonine protein kinase n=1 Tax=Candidatus Zymogenus saltonus TaxID=2844893 RepID=A0A9D8PP89_9DELT|nr:FHA domain-containing protein [Candidatus Zymogenus saltonus]